VANEESVPVDISNIEVKISAKGASAVDPGEEETPEDSEISFSESTTTAATSTTESGPQSELEIVISNSDSDLEVDHTPEQPEVMAPTKDVDPINMFVDPDDSW
jgi:hypothetical protein